MLEAGGRAQVFLPWAGFEGRSGADYLLGSEDQTNRARTLVAPTHPRWQSLEDADRALHARNAFEVLGLDLCHPSFAAALLDARRLPGSGDTQLPNWRHRNRHRACRDAWHPRDQ